MYLSALVLLLSACPPTNPKDTGPVDSEPVDTSEDTVVDDTSTEEPGLCADGAWGHITDPEHAIHVRADGDDAGDGSLSHPVASLDAALALTRARDTDKRIALGPGPFPAHQVLASDGGDDGTTLQGCSAEETLIEASSPDAPAIQASGVLDLVLEGLTLQGGTLPLQIWSGSTVALQSVHLRDGATAGLLIHGEATRADLVDVEIDGSTTGYGLTVQSRAVLSMQGGGIRDATGAGILLDDPKEITLSGIRVEGTRPVTDGSLGRGLQCQTCLYPVVIQGSTFDANQDAGLFFFEASDVTLSGNEVTGTLPGLLEDATTTGDGIVILRSPGMSPSWFLATLQGNVVSGSARAGVLLGGVTATVNGNTLSENGFGENRIVAQDGAMVSGSDAILTLSDDDALAR